MEFNHTITEIIDSVLATINQLKSTFDQQQQIRQGIRIAIIGSVNAGKSSLFNALLKQNRAIVTNIAGTTRDAIEAGLYKNGNYWTLIDTAGLRTTNDIIEQMGITRSHEEAHKADIILLVFDGSHLLTPAEQIVYQELLDTYNNKIIIINNKADLPQQPNKLLKNNLRQIRKLKQIEKLYQFVSFDKLRTNGRKTYLSSVRGELVLPHVPLHYTRGPRRRETKLGIKPYRTQIKKSAISTISASHTNSSNTAIETAIQEKIDHLFTNIQSPFLLNQRHYNALLSLENKLTTCQPMVATNPQYELISYHLNDALATLSELTGKTISEAGMDAVFREFCVGK